MKETFVHSDLPPRINQDIELIYTNVGKFYWPINVPNPGDHILYDGNGEGFAGRSLTLKMEDNNEIVLKGPWHTTADDLFRNTKVNLTQTILTFGVIAKKVTYNIPTAYSDIIYIDDNWTIGLFDRIEKLSQELSNKLNCTLYYKSYSCYGHVSFQTTPNNK